jgi:type IV secretory pathway VirB2 component (pilin)
MKALFPPAIRHRSANVQRPHRDRSIPSCINLRAAAVAFIVIALPTIAFAQSGSPFDTGFTAIQTLFTGTVAKVASLIAIVIGGYQFAHGEPGSKRPATTRRSPAG